MACRTSPNGVALNCDKAVYVQLRCCVPHSAASICFKGADLGTEEKAGRAAGHRRHKKSPHSFGDTLCEGGRWVGLGIHPFEMEEVVTWWMLMPSTLDIFFILFMRSCSDTIVLADLSILGRLLDPAGFEYSACDSWE